MMYKKLSIRKLFLVSLVIGLSLVILIKTPGFATTQPHSAPPFFATTTGIDINCTQSDPCNLVTAVFLAGDNEYVYVAGGTYTRTMDPMLTINKDIRLIGGWDGASSGPVVVDPAANVTILDGENTRRVIEVVDSPTPIISGITVMRGYHTLEGGGIYIEDSPLIQILDTTLYTNTAGSYGGGLSIDEGVIEITRSRFEDNSVTHGGGGLMLGNGSSATITENIFTENTASYGAAMNTDKASLSFYDNYVINNHGSSNSSAIKLHDIAGITTTGTTIGLYNNIIADNVGDGINVDGYTLNLYHNTIANNGDDGLQIGLYAHVALINNIFSGHNGSGGNSIFKSSATGVIDSSSNNLFWDNANNPYPGSNSIFGDPKFYGTYHILPDSAGRDAGTTSFITWDIDNQARLLGGIPDIGADETLPVYVPLVMK